MALARRGSRQLTDEVEDITEDEIKAQVKKQANWVMQKSAIVAVIATAIAVVLPIP